MSIARCSDRPQASTNETSDFDLASSRTAESASAEAIVSARRARRECGLQA
jgi:hypothetical protein